MEINLTDFQLKILQGKICPYCKSTTSFVDSSIIYRKSFGMIYYCKPCDAYCGVHKKTTQSLGRMANAELRELKKEAHKYFDVLWKEKIFVENRKEAYQRLSEYLNLPVKYTHIGMFSDVTCKKVINWSKQILNDDRRLDLDFGLSVNRPHYNIE